MQGYRCCQGALLSKAPLSATSPGRDKCMFCLPHYLERRQIPSFLPSLCYNLLPMGVERTQTLTCTARLSWATAS